MVPGLPGLAAGCRNELGGGALRRTRPVAAQVLQYPHGGYEGPDKVAVQYVLASVDQVGVFGGFFVEGYLLLFMMGFGGLIRGIG